MDFSSYLTSQAFDDKVALRNLYRWYVLLEMDFSSYLTSQAFDDKIALRNLYR
jgi:hypothetical protein